MIQQLQAKMMKIQEDLGNETVEASVGGMVTVVMTGHHEVRSVKIDPEAVDPSDIEMLEDSVMAAFNQALEKAAALTQETHERHHRRHEDPRPLLSGAPGRRASGPPPGPPRPAPPRAAPAPAPAPPGAPPRLAPRSPPSACRPR